MRMIPLLLSLLIAFAPGVMAKKVIIQGTAADFSGEDISLYRFMDHISGREEKMASQTISGEDAFQLSFDIEKVTLVTIRINDKNAHLYCEPGKVYNLRLSFDPQLNAGNLYDKNLSLKFNYPQPNELNLKVLDFINDYTTFLLNNEKLLITRSGLPAIREFEKQTLKKYEDVEHPYFHKYLQYNLAAMKDGVMASKKEIYENNIAGKKIPLDNYEYMFLFNQFYKKRFAEMALGKNGFQLLAALNGQSDYQKLMEIVKTDPYIPDNDSLAELFILKGLQENYLNKEIFKPAKILDMLRYIEKNGIYRNIATNILYRITYLSEGTKAPDFRLTDRNGDEYNLSRLAGKPVYLHFWSTRSTPSIREMVLLDELYEKYKGKLHILSINVDRQAAVMKEQLRGKDYGWIFSHYGTDKEIMERYEIFTLPTYVLIDQQGRIAQYPALRPATGIEKSIYELLKGK